MATLINKNGTDNNDALTYDSNASSTVVYHAGRGSDSIMIVGGKVTLYTDTGNNSMLVSGGAGHVIQVAATAAEGDKINGKDFLIINGANQVDAILGSGSDEIFIYKSNGKKDNGALSQVRGGLWGDTFSVNDGAESYQLYGEAGNDVFNINGGNNLVFWGGAANDAFIVTGGTGIKLRGGDSADEYTLSYKANAVDMQLGYGNDLVNVTAGNNHSIKANLGINTINLQAGTGHVITADIDQAASKKKGYTDADIKAGKGIGYGVDKVYVNGAQNVKVNLGDGKDYVQLANTEGCNIETEGWGDTIVVEAGANNNTINTGEGDDELVINGGEGNKFTLDAGNNKVTINGGKNNTIVNNMAFGTIIVNGGSANTIVNGSSNTSIYSGGGKATLHINGGTAGYYTMYGDEDLIIVDNPEGTKEVYDNILRRGGNDTVIFKEAHYTKYSTYNCDSTKMRIQNGERLTVYTTSGDDIVYADKVIYSGVNTLDGSDRIYIDGVGNDDNDSAFTVVRTDDKVAYRDYVWINLDHAKERIIVDDNISNEIKIAQGDKDEIMLVGTYIKPEDFKVRKSIVGSDEVINITSSTVSLEIKNAGRSIDNIYFQNLGGVLNNKCTRYSMDNLLAEASSTNKALSAFTHTDNFTPDDPFKFATINNVVEIFNVDKL